MNTPVVTIDKSRRDLSRTVALLAMPLADLRDALDARTDGLSAGRFRHGESNSAPTNPRRTPAPVRPRN